MCFDVCVCIVGVDDVCDGMDDDCDVCWWVWCVCDVMDDVCE